MNKEFYRDLQRDRVIDITTIGRKTGNPHRIEIAFHYIDKEIYISGMPGRRDWYANLVANPEFTFHLKQSVQADIPAMASPILAEVSRREILASIVQKWGRQNELESFVQSSPLVEVRLDARDSNV